MKKAAVIGLGQFGYQVAIGLTQKGFDVIALDKDPEIVSEVKDLVSQAVILDSIDEKAMRAVNIDNVDIVIVSFGTNVQASLLTTALLQRMNIEHISVRAINQLQESILKSMGIKDIINIEKEMGIQLSNTLSLEGIGRYVEISDRHSLVEVVVPKPLVGKSLKDLHMRTKFKINIVGIKQRKPQIDSAGEVAYEVEMTDVPDPEYPLGKDDILVIAGTDDNLNKFIQIGKSND
ncbi:potassium channel family protein [Thermoproteota archaeon]